MHNKILVVVSDFEDKELSALKSLPSHWRIHLLNVVPEIPTYYYQINQITEYNTCQIKEGKVRLIQLSKELAIDLDNCYVSQGRAQIEIKKIQQQIEPSLILSKNYRHSIINPQHTIIESSIDNFLNTAKSTKEFDYTETGEPTELPPIVSVR